MRARPLLSSARATSPLPAPVQPFPARPAPLRLALLPWMVAGVRTQYENLRLLDLPPGTQVDTVPIVPYRDGGLIERMPLLRSSHKGTLRSMSHVVPLLARRDYDAIWTQALPPLLPLLASSSLQLKRRPAIVYTIDTTPRLMDGFHQVYYSTPAAGPSKRVLRDALYRRLLRRCAAVTPWSQWAARSFVRDYGVPERCIHVIPPGVDLYEWTLPARRLAPADRQDASESFRLLFVGADFARKGGDLLLDVFRRHLAHRCELHLVTKAPIASTSERPQARSDAHGPGVFVYGGFGPNAPGLRALYEHCDALVLPTRADCYSLAAIEAMASGLPVITCPVGGIPEIVRHGETGYLIAPDDGSALLEAIQSLLDNRARAAALGRAGRHVVERRFDNARTSAALLELLLDLARKGPQEDDR